MRESLILQNINLGGHEVLVGPTYNDTLMISSDYDCSTKGLDRAVELYLDIQYK